MAAILDIVELAVMDWRTGGFVQYAAVALLVGSLAMLSERGAVRWEAGLIVALGYLVIVLSIGAITLLNWLIRRGRAARIASLFYLVPPVVALESWLWFGEKLGVAALVGMSQICWEIAATCGISLQYLPEGVYRRKERFGTVNSSLTL